MKDGMIDLYAHYLTLAQKMMSCGVSEEDRDKCRKLTPEQVLQIMQHSFTVGFLISNVRSDCDDTKTAVLLAQIYMKIYFQQLSSFLPMTIIEKNED